MTKAQILYDIFTKRPLSGGYVEFFPESGQAVIEHVGDLPTNLISHWMVELDKLRPVTAEELATSQAAEADRRSDFTASADVIVKALGLVMLDEINLLRTKADMPLRTTQQLVQAVKAKISEISG